MYNDDVIEEIVVESYTVNESFTSLNSAEAEP
jgi:hypothetical protein